MAQVANEIEMSIKKGAVNEKVPRKKANKIKSE